MDDRGQQRLTQLIAQFPTADVQRQELLRLVAQLPDHLLPSLLLFIAYGDPASRPWVPQGTTHG